MSTPLEIQDIPAGEENFSVDDRFNDGNSDAPPKRRERESRFSSRARTRSRSPRSRSRSRERRNGRDERRSSGSRDRGGIKSKRVYMCNMPYNLTWMDIKDMIKKEVGEAFVELYEQNGRSLGCCVAQFRTLDMAEKCIDKMDRYTINGRKIVVREEKEGDRQRHASHKTQQDLSATRGGGSGGGVMGNIGGGAGGMDRISHGHSHGGMDRMGPMSGNQLLNTRPAITPNTYGIDQKVLDELGIEPPIVNQVFVANLDYKVTPPKLEEVFKLAGKVVKVNLRCDTDGKSKGFGSVTFETPLEAVQAISMLHNQILYDRAMSVRMDKMADDKAFLPTGLKTLGKGLDALKQSLHPISDMGKPSGGSFSDSSGMMGGNSMMGSGMDSMALGMSNFSNQAAMGGGMNTGNLGMSSGMGMGNLGAGMGMMQNTGLTNMGSGLGMNMPGGMGLNMGMGSGLNDMSSAMGLGMPNIGASAMSSLMGNMGVNSDRLRMESNRQNLNLNNSLNSRDRMDRGDRGDRDSYSRNGGGGGGSLAQGGGEDSLIVKNLDYAVSWQEIKDHFRQVGDVKYARIKVENGKSTGQATVRMSSVEEARKALETMNGTQFRGRKLIVRPDRGERD